MPTVFDAKPGMLARSCPCLAVYNSYEDKHRQVAAASSSVQLSYICAVRAGASRRKSYFEEMMEEKAKEKVAGAGVRSSTPAAGDRPETPGPTRVAVQEELLRLRGAAAAQQAGLAELRAANATRRCAPPPPQLATLL